VTGRPTPRPALRKAPDSDVHPAEPRAGVVPLHGATSDAQRASEEPPAAPPTPPTPRPARPSVRAALSPRRRTPDPADRDLRRRRGSTTSDALRGKAADKLVDIQARVPKSLRKALRQEAKRRGVSPDELLVLLLRDYLEG
jgi:hypothetical protein